MLSLFPTFVHVAPLASAGARAPRGLRSRLLRECRQLEHDDRAGREWSRRSYPGGYTSYASQSRMQRVSPTFALLEHALDAHVRRYARALGLDLAGRRLAMTDCWVNVMRRQVVHPGHLHPLATISGTYYVQVPRGASGLKFEDPRLERFMASPPRRGRQRSWHTVPAREGQVVLFESWLRHEVPAHPVRAERISISFNYGWF
jgi:uncharacterized protein (TIGR02466 family)